MSSLQQRCHPKIFSLYSAPSRFLLYLLLQMTSEMITDSSVTGMSLIEAKICPSWWVPSRPVLKRCIPHFTKTSNDEDVQNDTVIVSGSDTMDGQEVTGGVLKSGAHQHSRIICQLPS